MNRVANDGQRSLKKAAARGMARDTPNWIPQAADEGRPEDHGADARKRPDARRRKRNQKEGRLEVNSLPPLRG